MLTVHDGYRRHSHHAEVMAPSIEALLLNAKKLKLTKCALSGGLGRWTTYTPTITLRIIAFEHDGIERLTHFVLVKNTTSVQFVQSEVMLVGCQRVKGIDYL